MNFPLKTFVLRKIAKNNNKSLQVFLKILSACFWGESLKLNEIANCTEIVFYFDVETRRTILWQEEGTNIKFSF